MPIVLLVAFVMSAILPEAAGAATATAEDAARLRDRIELFADLAPQDSITAVRAAAVDTMELETVDVRTGGRRRARYPVPAPQLQKLLAVAPPSRTLSEHGGSATPPPAALEKARLREDYMGGQLTASTFVYGVSLTTAFQLEGGAVIVIPAFAVTGSLIAHSVFSYNNPLSEAQVVGMNYAAATSILGSYAIPFMVAGSNGDAFRVGSILALAAYPASLYPGYHIGGRYTQNPWDLQKKMYFAGTFATAGAVLPWVYLKDPDPDVYLRLAPLQFMAFGIAGHYAADRYRSGERLTDGVVTGIFTHTGLGTLAGFTLVSLAEPADPRAGIGVVLASAAAGFGEGLWFFNDRNDDADLANYSGLGLAAGLMLPGTVAYASNASAANTLLAMTVGGFAGYMVVYNMLSMIHEDRNGRGASRSGHGADRVAEAGFAGLVKSASFSLAPVPEFSRRAPEEAVGARRESRPASHTDVRYRIPGLTLRF